MIPGLIFGTILYWIVDLNNDRFGEFIGILLLEIVTAISLGLAVSAVSPNPEIATAIAIPCMIIPLLFGGFYSKLTVPTVCFQNAHLTNVILHSQLGFASYRRQLGTLCVIYSMVLPSKWHVQYFAVWSLCDSCNLTLLLSSIVVVVHY